MKYCFNITLNNYYIIKLYFIIAKNCLKPNICDPAK